MKQKVVKIDNIVLRNARGTKGSNVLTLACGHTKSQKGSVKIPAFCNCKECDDIASGRRVDAEIPAPVSEQTSPPNPSFAVLASYRRRFLAPVSKKEIQ